MKSLTTQAIILSRTDFGEAARIITFLTPEQGKVRAMARGVRKSKSKMAGALELFSVADITYLVGRSEVNTLMSARLARHYGNIVNDLDRTNAGYQFIKELNQATADNPEPAYFKLLEGAFRALDDKSLGLDLIELWFRAQLLKLSGRTPNLQTDKAGQKLDAGKRYMLDPETMALAPSSGKKTLDANHIKFLRFVFANNTLANLQRIKGSADLAKVCGPALTVLTPGF